MGLPAAKMGDQVVAADTHLVLMPTVLFGIPVPIPLTHPFNGLLQQSLSLNVNIMGSPAATVGSVAVNTPPHTPTSPGVSFVNPPTNLGTVTVGSSTVRINGLTAARNGDLAVTCNDPADLPVGTVVATGTVFMG